MNKHPIYTRWWFWVSVFVLSIGVAIGINEAYKFNRGYITMWNAADMLAFYGAYLAFIGTTVLGIVAVHQNKKANQLNSEMQQLQQASFVSMISVNRLEVNERNVEHPNYTNTNFADLEVIDLKMQDFVSSSCYHVDVAFLNDSDYPIVEIGVHAGKLNDCSCLIYGIENIAQKPIYIAKNGAANIRFIIPSKVFKATNQDTLTLQIWFVNIFDYHTKATLRVESLNGPGSRTPYKYRLAKFTDIKPKNEEKCSE